MIQNRNNKWWWWGLLRQRCPCCCQGPLFRTTLETYKTCPVCGLVVEREPGYFVGAMYFSYFLAIVLLTGFYFLWYLLLPDLNVNLVALLATLCFLPLAPLTYRYSRVIWVYFDRWAWPEFHSDGSTQS